MLITTLAHAFGSNVRSKGNGYAASGRVRDLSVDSDLITATVRGTQIYDIAIDVEQNPRSWRLDAHCTCPHAADGSLCKHIWATLVRAEIQGLRPLGALPERITIRLAQETSAEARMLISPWRRSAAALPSRRKDPRAKRPKKPRRPAWMRQLEEAAPPFPRAMPRPDPTPLGPLAYVLDLARSRERNGFILALMQRPDDVELVQAQPPAMPGAAGADEFPTAPRGRSSKAHRFTLSTLDIPRLRDAADRAICGMLAGAARPGREAMYGYRSHTADTTSSSLWQVNPQLVPMLAAMLAEMGRLEYREDDGSAPRPLGMSADPWELVLSIVPMQGDQECVARPMVRRCVAPPGAVAAPMVRLHDAALLLDGAPGLAILRGDMPSLVPLETHRSFDFAHALAGMPASPVKESELPLLLETLKAKDLALPVLWPRSWNARQVMDVEPKGRIRFRPQNASRRYFVPIDSLAAEVSFDYGDASVGAGEAGCYVRAGSADDSPTFIRRWPERERALLDSLSSHKVVRSKYSRDSGAYQVIERRMARTAATLIGEGWTVLADDAALRPAGAIKINVASGIDWFELRGDVDFGDGAHANIVQVLEALKQGERIIRLGDGSLGMLPEAWLQRHTRWMQLGSPGENGSSDALRFSKVQVGLIDALLSEMPEATCDRQVAAARRRLATFECVRPRNEPKSFQGELRPYQREGLGWLRFLAEFGFGGILADDMGLGKTVQLLAHMLDMRRTSAKGPWLVVAPKSLIFNWGREAARFAPQLKVLAYAGMERKAHAGKLGDYDLVLTTYNTMRLDIDELRKIQFACIVLDEAQAIKNATSQSAKASRLLKAHRRLAMTGTPVENRLDDLWSILEFLNPGMLGTAKAFREVIGRSDGDDLSLIRRAVRPFILRRTKDRVAPELPARSEQTLTCELAPPQRALYNGLLKHYRDSLLGKDGQIERKGLNRSRIHVLEALLRLRQAACHPALIETKPLSGKALNGKPTGKPQQRANGRTERGRAPSTESAKIETLMEMLDEILQEEHKALIFSQFTSLLALVRQQLDARNIAYQYLDGATSAKDREAAVDRFQSDPEARVFLISLKAGGVGLNLTAADYVFLLDPWWNPAVEAQAIDRTHRIGQDKKVIAYRLIASGTVEERIQELQATKRELAEAVVGEDAAAGPLSTLTRDELAWLLS